MPHQLTRTECADLADALSGTYRMDLSDRLTVLWTALPPRVAASLARHQGRLYVLVDPDKPGAHAQARLLVSEWRGCHTPTLDFGDPEMERDWVRSAALPSVQPDHPVEVVPIQRGNRPGLAALAACFLTGAAAMVAKLAMALEPVVSGGPVA